MNNTIKRAMSFALAIFSLISSGTVETSAIEYNRTVKEVGFKYMTPIYGINYRANGKFALCSDIDGDGKYTQSKDDASVCCVSTDSNGNVVFKSLETNKTYFITQIETNEEFEEFNYIDKNVYSFKLKDSDANKNFVDLRNYLPADTYIASKTIPLSSIHLDYNCKTINSELGYTDNIHNAEFAICPDVNGDGVFTKGIDDTVIYKSKEKNGNYYFGQTEKDKDAVLRTDSTYFVTQLKGGNAGYKSFNRDKNIYPFCINISSSDMIYSLYDINLLSYLPLGTYLAKPKIKTWILSYISDSEGKIPFEGITFAICPDLDNDGQFTKGIDDKKICKVKSGESFTGLESDKRYFITQLSAEDSDIICNKKVYSFTINSATAYHESEGIILNGFLPPDAVMIRRKTAK